MISRISIRDFAVIENAEVEFGPGLNIITGETGAGKSVVVEAMSLALGSRADTAFVRTGKEKAVVQMVAELGGEEYILTREVSSGGRNLCRINGEIVTLGQLSELCSRLADIHGQYDHQSLLDPEKHLGIIDKYGAAEIAPVAELTASLYAEYTEKKRRLRELTENARENARMRDLLKFEADEIASARLYAGEDGELTERITLLKNSEKIYASLANAYEILDGDEGSVLSGLNSAMRLTEEAGEYSESLGKLAGGVSDAYYALEDLAKEVRRSRDGITFSESELNEAIERLDEIDRLKRKYGGTVEAVLKYAEDAENRLNEAENADTLAADLEADIAVLAEKLNAASARLTKLRKDAAEDLGKRIGAELSELNFNNSVFDTEFTELADFTAKGRDRAEFLISTNRGEPVKPLAKIASGGEISRIMLAFKRLTADFDGIPTMVFDEIDSGISGVTAAVVGAKMRQIAENHQIICITHLPQIAANGDANYLIEKEPRGETVATTVRALSEEEKELEIARLLGGVSVTDAALENARELIKQVKGLG